MNQKPAQMIYSVFFTCTLLLVMTASACGQSKSETPASTQTEAKTGNTVSGSYPPRKGAIFQSVPEKIDPQARYLFYLHGKIIEEKGIRPTDERYGVYEYEAILSALSGKGLMVISEARPKDTNPKEYAAKVVEQIKKLIEARVPPSHITVVGASKGSLITMLASTLLQHQEVNFVLMSNCNDWVLENYEIDLHGNVLSIYDFKDTFGQTCRKFFDGASGLNRHKEIELKLGTGHAILYKPLKEWIVPVVEWANQ